MKKNILWFSLVELVIVVTIMITLTSIWLVSYMSSLVDTRNATRISEVSNLTTSLKTHKTKNWLYPFPWNQIQISNGGGNTIVLQWELNDDVYTTDIVTKPKDPFVKNRYYSYSITSNRLFHQIATVLEKEEVSGNSDGLMVYVVWDFQTKSITTLPSILFASQSSFDIQTNSWLFIVDKWTFNIPYNLEWIPESNTTSFSQIIGENNVNIPKFFWYSSCWEIYENGGFTWTWWYQIMDTTSVNGAIVCAYCESQNLISTWSFSNNQCN